jgi:hypothetical protein
VLSLIFSLNVILPSLLFGCNNQERSRDTKSVMEQHYFRLSRELNESLGLGPRFPVNKRCFIILELVSQDAELFENRLHPASWSVESLLMPLCSVQHRITLTRLQAPWKCLSSGKSVIRIHKEKVLPFKRYEVAFMKPLLPCAR